VRRLEATKSHSEVRRISSRARLRHALAARVIRAGLARPIWQHGVETSAVKNR
jgi:hypothetical protein